MSESKQRQYPIDPLAQFKYDKCKKCKYYQEKDTQCTICGCNIRIVVNEERSECPIGKW